MGTMGSVNDLVEVWLQSARELIGTTISPELPTLSYAHAPQSLDAWNGRAESNARATGLALNGQRDRLRAAHDSLAETARQASLITQGVHRELAAIEQDWKQDLLVLKHISDTPQGQAALLQAAQSRINEAIQAMQEAGGQFTLAAERVRAAAGELLQEPGRYTSAAALPTPNTGADSTEVHAVRPLNSGDPWDHIEDIMDFWTNTNNPELPQMPEPYSPEF